MTADTDKSLGQNAKAAESTKDALLGSQDYSDAPEGPGLVGGPATGSVPKRVEGTKTIPTEPGGDGGEGTLSSQPRETGGHRPNDAGNQG